MSMSDQVSPRKDFWDFGYVDFNSGSFNRTNSQGSFNEVDDAFSDGEDQEVNAKQDSQTLPKYTRKALKAAAVADKAFTFEIPELTEGFFTSKAADGFTPQEKKIYTYVEWAHSENAEGFFGSIVAGAKHFIAEKWLISNQVNNENYDIFDRQRKFYNAIVKAKNAFNAFAKKMTPETHAAATEAFEKLHADWDKKAGGAKAINDILKKERALEAGKKAVLSPDISRALLEFSVEMALRKDGYSSINIRNALNPRKLASEFADLSGKGYNPELTKAEQRRVVGLKIQDAKVLDLYTNPNTRNFFMTYADVYARLAPQNEDAHTEVLFYNPAGDIASQIANYNDRLLQVFVNDNETDELQDELGIGDLSATKVAYQELQEAIAAHKAAHKKFTEEANDGITSGFEAYSNEGINLDLAALDDLYAGKEAAPGYAEYKTLKDASDKKNAAKQAVDAALTDIFTELNGKDSKSGLNAEKARLEGLLKTTRAERDGALSAYRALKETETTAENIEADAAALAQHSVLFKEKSAVVLDLQGQLTKIQEQITPLMQRMNGILGGTDDLAKTQAARAEEFAEIVMPSLTRKTIVEISALRAAGDVVQSAVLEESAIQKIVVEYQDQKSAVEQYAQQRLAQEQAVAKAKEEVVAKQTVLEKVGFVFNDSNDLIAIDYPGFKEQEVARRITKGLLDESKGTVQTITTMRSAIKYLDSAKLNEDLGMVTVPLKQDQQVVPEGNVFDVDVTDSDKE